MRGVPAASNAACRAALEIAMFGEIQSPGRDPAAVAV
jgi:hypothetical protein